MDAGDGSALAGLPAAELAALVVANLPQTAVYLFDHDLRYVVAAGEAIRVAGLGELTGLRLSDVASGESLRILEGHYRAALEGVESDFEHPGEDLRRWYRVRIRPVRAADGSVLCGLVLTDDVTDARRDREEVRVAHEFQAAVLRATPDIVSVYDFESRQTVWASRGIEEILGVELHEVRHQGAALVHADDRAGWTAAMDDVQASADGAVVEGSGRVLHKDGTYRVLARRSTPFRRDETGRVVQALNVSWDVTDEHAVLAELDRGRAFQHAVLSTTPDLIMLMDPATGRPTWTSRDPRELMGWSFEQLRDRGEQPLHSLVHPEDLEGLRLREQEAIASEQGHIVQARFRAQHADGSWRWLERRMTPFAGDAEAAPQLLMLVREVTEQVRTEQEIEHAALHDQLTGLANRRLVSERMTSALAECLTGRQIALLFLDLNGFKPINDVHGHRVGDAVLVSAARRMEGVLREGDTVGRIGGDEFVVILNAPPEVDATALSAELARRLDEALAYPYVVNGLELTVSASIGVTLATPNDTPDTLLNRADAAMYKAKADRILPPQRRATR